MANLNKVMLIGRLTRDPEARTFSNGGKVVKFGFAVNNRRKNQSSGQWEDEPVYIDCEIFDRGESKQAERFEQTVRKGQQIFVEGHLKLNEWTDKEGQKRSKLQVVVDTFQYLEPKGEGGGNGGYAPRATGNSGNYNSAPARRPPMPPPGRSAQQPSNDYGDNETEIDSPASAGGDEDIPF